MIQGFADGLIWPAAALALLGWLVPRGLSLVFPEGVRPLLLLALASAQSGAAVLLRDRRQDPVPPPSPTTIRPASDRYRADCGWPRGP